MSSHYPVLRHAGGPYDLGLAHGRALADEIRANLDLYEMFIQGLTGKDRQRCLALAAGYQPVLEDLCPHLVEEMRGIAAGAGISLTEVLLINARTEVTAMDADPETAHPAECTALGLAGERTVDGRPLMAQNWDWHKRLLRGSAVFVLTPENGPRIATLAEAGQVGKIGVNEHGVGVLINILLAGQPALGLPVHVLMRLVLEQQDAAAAAALVKKGPNASANHLMVGDPQGFILGLEITADRVEEIPLADGQVLHTNHYRHPDLAPQDLGRLLFADSTPRYDRARKKLAERRQWDAAGIREILRNHEDGPASICRHVDEALPEHMHIMTTGSIILEPAERRMHVSRGQPCQNPYQEITLS